jgi:signal transduction histidine kinase
LTGSGPDGLTGPSGPDGPTRPPPVLLGTPDRRLAAAVASFLEPLGLAAVEVDGTEAAPRPGTVAVLDSRQGPLPHLPAWAGAGVRIVVVAPDLDAAREAVEHGAHDFVTPEHLEQTPLRVWMAVNAGATPASGTHLRKLVRHDLRSPLAVLLGQCEILSIGLGGPLTEKQRRSVEAMERKTRELQAMIDQVTAELGALLGWEPRR